MLTVHGYEVAMKTLTKFAEGIDKSRALDTAQAGEHQALVEKYTTAMAEEWVRWTYPGSIGNLSLHPKIRTRSGQAMVQLQGLKKQVLGNGALPLQPHCEILQSLGASVLTLHASGIKIHPNDSHFD